jgi:hypothetical protein
LAFNDFSSNGFFMQFSLPKFPMILEDLKINYTLSSDSKAFSQTKLAIFEVDSLWAKFFLRLF